MPEQRVQTALFHFEGDGSDGIPREHEDLATAREYAMARSREIQGRVEVYAAHDQVEVYRGGELAAKKTWSEHYASSSRGTPGRSITP